VKIFFQKTSEQYYGTDLPGSVRKFLEKEGVINSRVHYGPQPGLGEISGKASPSLSGAGSPTQLYESDGNKESRKYKNLALAMATCTAFIIFASAGAAQQCAYLYIPKVQGSHNPKATRKDSTPPSTLIGRY